MQNHGQSILQKENKTWDPVPIQTLVFWMSDALNRWSSDIEAVRCFQNTVWSWCWISVLSAVNTGSLYFEVNLCNHGAHLSFYAAYIMSLDTVQFSRCFALTLKDVSRGFNNSRFTCGVETPIQADRKYFHLREKPHKVSSHLFSALSNAPVFQRIWPTFIRLDLRFPFLNKTWTNYTNPFHNKGNCHRVVK